MRKGRNIAILIAHMVQLFTAIIHSLAQGVTIRPSEFVTHSNYRLALWRNHELSNGVYQPDGLTMLSCLDACLQEANCVAITFSEGRDDRCYTHLKNADPPGCSTESTHLLFINLEGQEHYKIISRCYTAFAARSDTMVLSRTVMRPIEVGVPRSISDCSALCQMEPDCAAAEWFIEGACSLFPQLPEFPLCRALGNNLHYSVVLLPCHPAALLQLYPYVYRGYHESETITSDTSITNLLLCENQCRAQAGCLAFSFDFSVNGAGCRTYSDATICTNNVVNDTGDNSQWYTYRRPSACGTTSTNTTTLATTTQSTLRTTKGPPIMFSDYDLMDNLQVRGGQLFSASRTVSECKMACSADMDCTGFDYVSDGQQCFHHSVDSVCLTPTEHVGDQHYRKKSFSCTWKYSGQSLVGGVYYRLITDPIRCERACRLSYQCRGFDFDTASYRCYLHFAGNICNLKNQNARVTHYRVKGESCEFDKEPLVYENTRLVGGRNIGTAGSALDCFSLCLGDEDCSGIDFNKEDNGCWFQYLSNACNLPAASDCCDHLKVPGICNLIEEKASAQQALVDVKTPHNWHQHYVTHQCHDNSMIGTICDVLRTISSDGILPSLRFVGTVPTDDRLMVRFETITSSSMQVDLLETRIDEALLSQQLRDHSAKVYFYALPPKLDVQTVTPVKGPRAGGTTILFSGYNLGFIQTISIDNTQCPIVTVTPAVILCKTMRLDNNVYLGIGRNMSIYTGGPQPIDTPFSFTYLPDPIILSVHPLSTILSGGIYLTVSGSALDSVHTPVMITTVRTIATNTSEFFQTNCIVDSSVQMRCPTPQFERAAARKRRDTVNMLDNKQFTIGFILEGVLQYQNLTGSLEKYSQITVHLDPIIKQFPDRSVTFISTWPIQDTTIEVEGERLTDGLQADDVFVMIGEARCANAMLFTNKIICEPPSSRPPVKLEERLADSKIPVKVIIGNVLPFSVGHMVYQQNLWEYPPGRWGILGALGGVLLLIIVIFICCCCGCCDCKESKHSLPDWHPPSSRTDSSRSFQRNGYGGGRENYRSSSRPTREPHRESRRPRSGDYYNRGSNHRESNVRRSFNDNHNGRPSYDTHGNHRRSFNDRHSREPPYREYRSSTHKRESTERRSSDRHSQSLDNRRRDDICDELDDVYGVTNNGY